MSNVQPVILSTRPMCPVDYKESAIQKAIDASYVFAEVKEDGNHLNLVVCPTATNATVNWLSREGKAFPNLWDPETARAPLSLDGRWMGKFWAEWEQDGLFKEGFMLQAELILLNEEGSQMPCKDISGTLRRDPLKYGMIPLSRVRVIAFDVVPLNAVLAKEDYEVEWSIRREHLHQVVATLRVVFPEIDFQISQGQECVSLAEVSHCFRSARAANKEGLVVKDALSFWKRGKKSGWWKVKPEGECDGVVVGLVWGEPDLSNAGRVVGFEVLTEHGIKVNATGLTRAEMDKATEAVINANVAFGLRMDGFMYTADQEAASAAHGLGLLVNPFEGHTCAITYMERTETSYRHPNFDRFRGVSDPMLKE